MSGPRTAIIWLLGVGLGAAFLWLALRAVDVQAALVIALQADQFDAFGIVICGLAFVGAKVVRWGWIVGHLRPLPPRRLFAPVLAGIAVNYAIPHGGELVRAWMVGEREGLSKAALLASIAVERLFDFCAILLLGLVSLLAGRAVLATLGAPLWALLTFVLVILAATLPFAVWPERALSLSRTLLAPIPARARERVMWHLDQGSAGLSALQRGATASRVLMLSIVQWVLMAACAWLSLRAVGIEPGFLHAVAIVLLLVAGTTLPTAPAHVGTTQVAFLLAAAPFGVGREEAIAASLVYNVFLPVPLIVVGVGVLLRAPGRLEPPAKPDRR